MQPIAQEDLLHQISGRSLTAPYPDHCKQLLLGMGCFWGAERMFWTLPGVWVTSVGFAGGKNPEPTYRQVCTGDTGHAEVVHVVYDPAEISLMQILKVFWEEHNPTAWMRQGNDVGSQYRTCLFLPEEDLQEANESKSMYQKLLTENKRGEIKTIIEPPTDYWLAENYHQQYLEKNPNGYCGLAGCNVEFKLAN